MRCLMCEGLICSNFLIKYIGSLAWQNPAACHLWQGIDSCWHGNDAHAFAWRKDWICPVSTVSFYLPSVAHPTATRCFYNFAAANSLECKHTALHSHRVTGVVVLVVQVVEGVAMTVDTADITHTDLVVKMQRGRGICCCSTFDWLTGLETLRNSNQKTDVLTCCGFCIVCFRLNSQGSPRASLML